MKQNEQEQQRVNKNKTKRKLNETNRTTTRQYQRNETKVHNMHYFQKFSKIRPQFNLAPY